MHLRTEIRYINGLWTEVEVHDEPPQERSVKTYRLVQPTEDLTALTADMHKPQPERKCSTFVAGYVNLSPIWITDAPEPPK